MNSLPFQVTFLFWYFFGSNSGQQFSSSLMIGLGLDFI
jgi:hypothetical protein